MKFVVSSTDFLSHLQTIGRVISSKNTIPVVDSFLFSMNEKNVLDNDAKEEVLESDKKYTYDEAFQASLAYFREPSVCFSIPKDDGFNFWYWWILSFSIDETFSSYHQLSNRYFAPYMKFQIPNGPIHQRRNRRERLQVAFLREGGEIRQRYDVHSELYRDRHRRLAQEISIGQKTAGNISLAGESQRALSLLSNLNPEA